MGLIRAVLDTNVLIAATLNPNGVSHELVAMGIEYRLQIVLSKFITGEYRRKMREKFPMERRLANAFIEEVALYSFMVPPAKMNRYRVRSVVKTDPDDDHIITTAIAGRAQFVVTLDNDLIDRKKFRSIRVQKPGEFMMSLETE